MGKPGGSTIQWPGLRGLGQQELRAGRKLDGLQVPHVAAILRDQVDVRRLAHVDEGAAVAFAVGEKADQLHRRVGHFVKNRFDKV